MMITILVSWMVSRFTSGSRTPEWTSWINWSVVPPVVKLATVQTASFWTLNSPCRKRTFTFFIDSEELKFSNANLVQYLGRLMTAKTVRAIYIEHLSNLPLVHEQTASLRSPEAGRQTAMGPYLSWSRLISLGQVMGKKQALCLEF